MAPVLPVTCDVRSLQADLAAVDALARLQLAARRRGRALRLSGASDALRALIDLVGLGDALPGVLERQPEEWEDRLGVEEEAELDDPPL
jgi:STAS domain